MKKSVCLFIVSMTLAFGVQAQLVTVDQLPVKVRSAFSQEYPSATNWSFTSINQGGYSATFQVNDMRHYAEVDSAGNYVLLRNDVMESQLPSSITSMLKKDFPKHKIEEAERIEKQDVVTYEIEIEGEPDYEFVFDAQGKVLEKKLD